MWLEDYLTKKDIFTSFLNYVIIVAFVHIFNIILRFTTLGVHANYFGTMGEEYDVINQMLSKLTEVIFKQEVPLVHQLPLFAVILGIEFLMILPFHIFKTKKDRKNQLEEIVALGNLKAQQNFRKTGSKGSQILVNSAEKARPSTPKKSTSDIFKSGFVSVNKQVQVNNDEENK